MRIWRRSYDVPPPPLRPDDERSPGTTRATRASTRRELPRTECLKDTVARFLPVLARRRSCPAIRAGRRVIIAAHGNSLRALVKYLDDVSDEEIVGAQHPDRVPAGLRAR